MSNISFENDSWETLKTYDIQETGPEKHCIMNIKYRSSNYALGTLNIYLALRFLQTYKYTICRGHREKERKREREEKRERERKTKREKQRERERTCKHIYNYTRLEYPQNYFHSI